MGGSEGKGLGVACPLKAGDLNFCVEPVKVFFLSEVFLVKSVFSKSVLAKVFLVKSVFGQNCFFK